MQSSDNKPEVSHYNHPSYDVLGDLSLLFGEGADELLQEDEAPAHVEDIDDASETDFVELAKHMHAANFNPYEDTTQPVSTSSQTPDEHPDFGVLQDLVNRICEELESIRSMDLLVQAELSDVSPELMEVVEMLPPGPYTRRQLCDQLNSILVAHGWSNSLGVVE